MPQSLSMQKICRECGDVTVFQFDDVSHTVSTKCGINLSLSMDHCEKMELKIYVHPKPTLE